LNIFDATVKNWDYNTWLCWYGSHLVLSYCGSIKKDRKASNLHEFLKTEHYHKKWSLSFTIYGKSIKHGSMTWILLVFRWLFRVSFVTTLALGLRLKQGLVKVWAKYKARESHFMFPGNARKCKGMNLHTPKWIPTLGVGVPMNSQIFIE